MTHPASVEPVIPLHIAESVRAPTSVSVSLTRKGSSVHVCDDKLGTLDGNGNGNGNADSDRDPVLRHPHLRRNRLDSSDYAAVRIYAGGRSTSEDNNLTGNGTRRLG